METRYASMFSKKLPSSEQKLALWIGRSLSLSLRICSLMYSFHHTANLCPLRANVLMFSTPFFLWFSTFGRRSHSVETSVAHSEYCFQPQRTYFLRFSAVRSLYLKGCVCVCVYVFEKIKLYRGCGKIARKCISKIKGLPRACGFGGFA